MEIYFNQLLFGVLPYLAGSVFLLGSLLRYERGQYTWRAMSSQTLSNTATFRWGSILFHVGIILLFFGHLFGLLTPQWLYQALGLSTAVKQQIAIAAGGFFGMVCLIGMTILIWRRLFNERVRVNSARADTFILVLLYLQLLTGLATILVSIDHPEGYVMVQLGNWAQSIVTFQAGAWEYVVDVHWIYKLHMFLGMIMFTAFPFSRLVHIWSWPVGYLRRAYQVVRAR
ncbi:nitrate reductase gamma subunit [Natronospira proteinivora]|uniref:Nitrate reductase gamma subunit n=1 Tax=Natronospira proteinivora TaxID=1807133 RepID=A0ABT1GAB3_9GAMM|nr:respiratory nitrate reductase subunit gamma [Natronospira proteinivora]MCP1727193.1 nitrate reductase gamma subunit [Natronospira proteinivora]